MNNDIIPPADAEPNTDGQSTASSQISALEKEADKETPATVSMQPAAFGKKKSPFGKILLTILVLALLGGLGYGVYYFWQQNRTLIQERDAAKTELVKAESTLKTLGSDQSGGKNAATSQPQNITSSADKATLAASHYVCMINPSVGCDKLTTKVIRIVEPSTTGTTTNFGFAVIHSLSADKVVSKTLVRTSVDNLDWIVVYNSMDDKVPADIVTKFAVPAAYQSLN